MGTRKIRVAFSYIAYPVAMARYMVEALERRDDVELWVTGPFTGRQIPWMGGMFLPQSYVKEPDLPLPFSTPPQIIYQFAEGKAPWRPDVWIEGNAGLHTIGRPSCKYVVIGTDPHVLDYTKLRKEADIFYSMQGPYMQPGDKWLPYGYDPIHHRATENSWDERKYDVALVGLPYPERKSFMDELASRGYSVYLENGPAYDDAHAIYNDSRLGLNLSSREDTTARVFELMAMRVTPVLNYVPDLIHMFGRDCYAGFDTAEEGIALCVELLDDPMRAQELAHDAREAVEEHTWDARMEQVLKDAKVL
jgi:hypothetical protein